MIFPMHRDHPAETDDRSADLNTYLDRIETLARSQHQLLLLLNAIHRGDLKSKSGLGLSPVLWMDEVLESSQAIVTQVQQLTIAVREEVAD